MMEMLVAMVLITVVIGVVVRAVSDMERRHSSESAKIDAVQNTRDFVDQMVRDIHMVGYPPAAAIAAGNINPNAGAYCTDSAANGAVNALVRMNPNIACGIVRFSPTNVVYEGDLDGSGNVSVVFLNLVAGNGNTCPCTLQRGVLAKANWVANPAAVPPFFTTVNGVLNSGNGAGAATFPVVMNGPGNYAAYSRADVFAAYDANAVPVAAACNLGTPGNPGTVPDCSQIRSLQIAVNVAPTFADPTTKQFPVYSVTSKARINF